MKIEAYEQMISELRKENEDLKNQLLELTDAYRILFSDNLVDKTVILLKAKDFYVYNVKENRYYLFITFENNIQSQIEITKDFYLKLNK